MRLINLDIIKRPTNWIVVGTMIFFLLIGFSVLYQIGPHGEGT